MSRQSMIGRSVQTKEVSVLLRRFRAAASTLHCTSGTEKRNWLQQRIDGLPKGE